MPTVSVHKRPRAHRCFIALLVCINGRRQLSIRENKKCHAPHFAARGMFLHIETDYAGPELIGRAYQPATRFSPNTRSISCCGNGLVNRLTTTITTDANMIQAPAMENGLFNPIS